MKQKYMYPKTPAVRSSRNKLNAQKYVSADGTLFASKLEGRRYEELLILQMAGKIANLECQKKYVLIPAKRRSDGTLERACSYISDFEYDVLKIPAAPAAANAPSADAASKAQSACPAAPAHVTEDVKGSRATNSAIYALFVVKRKLMLSVHGIEVQEWPQKPKKPRRKSAKTPKPDADA